MLPQLPLLPLLLATTPGSLPCVRSQLDIHPQDDMRDMNLSAVAAERLAVATRRATLLEGRSGDVTPHPQLSARERTGERADGRSMVDVLLLCVGRTRWSQS